MNDHAAAVAIVCCLSALAPSAARADACNNAQTQMDMTACAGKALDAADKALNVTYDKVMNRLSGGDGRKLLVAAEKQWIVFRDRECDFVGSGTIGGSAHPMIVADCRADMTKARTRTLDALLACKEGDLSCPLPPK